MSFQTYPDNNVPNALADLEKQAQIYLSSNIDYQAMDHNELEKLITEIKDFYGTCDSLDLLVNGAGHNNEYPDDIRTRASALKISVRTLKNNLFNIQDPNRGYA